MQSHVTWNRTSTPYVPPEHSYTCTESAISPAPSLVENFTVSSYSIDGPQITLDLRWSPPTMPNGVLKDYQICIGGEPLPNNTVPDHSYACVRMPNVS